MSCSTVYQFVTVICYDRRFQGPLQLSYSIESGCSSYCCIKGKPFLDIFFKVMHFMMSSHHRALVPHVIPLVGLLALPTIYWYSRGGVGGIQVFSQQGTVMNLHTLSLRIQFFPNYQHITVVQVMHHLHHTWSAGCMHAHEITKKCVMCANRFKMINIQCT